MSQILKNGWSKCDVRKVFFMEELYLLKSHGGGLCTDLHFNIAEKNHKHFVYKLILYLVNNLFLKLNLSQEEYNLLIES